MQISTRVVGWLTCSGFGVVLLVCAAVLAEGSAPDSTKDAGSATPPNAKGSKSSSPKSKPSEPSGMPNPTETRRRLADLLSMTELQRVSWTDANRQLDAERAVLLHGLEPLMADLRKVLLDESATAEQRQAAVKRLDGLHAAFRAIELERRDRLEALLSAEQKKRLEELTKPDLSGDPFPPREGVIGRVHRNLRKLALSDAQREHVRPLCEQLEARLIESDKARQSALDEFHRAVAAELRPEQKSEWESARAEWDRSSEKKPRPKSSGPAPGASPPTAKSAP